MELPLQIVFHNMGSSSFIESSIREHAEKLSRHSDKISRCRVVVDIPHKHHQKGNSFEIRIDLAIPQKEIVVCENGHKIADYNEVKAAIRDAFTAANRQIDDFYRCKRNEERTAMVASVAMDSTVNEEEE